MLFRLLRRAGIPRHSVPAVAHWQSPFAKAPDLLAELHADLEAVQSPQSVLPTEKGRPKIHYIKRELAQDLQKRLEAGELSTVNRDTLRAAHQLAAVDITDPITYRVYIALVEHSNASALEALRAYLTAHVVLHISCAARLDRAMESSKSFMNGLAPTTSQLTVVGSDAATLSFDAIRGILTLPVPDSYEHLPSKVVGAMFYLAMTERVKAVLKVDDDHRLRDASAMDRDFSRVQSHRPQQMGVMNDIIFLGNNLRAWHFGKCSDVSLNSRPYTLPGTTRWLTGASGYFLNAAAVRLLHWSYVYFADYVRLGVYEDVIVSDLLERQGAKLMRTNMDRLLSTVGQY